MSKEKDLPVLIRNYLEKSAIPGLTQVTVDYNEDNMFETLRVYFWFGLHCKTHKDFPKDHSLRQPLLDCKNWVYKNLRAGNIKRFDTFVQLSPVAQ